MFSLASQAGFELEPMAQHVNPFGLDTPAPHIDCVLEPGDSSILARPLVPLGCGTHSHKALWGSGIDVLGFGEQQGARRQGSAELMEVEGMMCF